MEKEIKNILKKDCKNPNHKNVGTRLINSEIICLDCRDEQVKKISEDLMCLKDL